MVERQLPKLNVVGSIPIARSIFAQRFLKLGSRPLIEIRWRDLIEVIDAAALQSPSEAPPKWTTNANRTAAT